MSTTDLPSLPETPAGASHPESPGVATGDWFDVLDAAQDALHNVQYPLRAMELPPYPAGGTCGIHNLATALEAIVKAQEALDALRNQLGHWKAMDAAYGPSANATVSNAEPES